MEKVAKCDAGFRDSSPYPELFLNIYRVLLTRIKNGIFIWFSDKKTEEYFKEICIDKPDLQTKPLSDCCPTGGSLHNAYSISR